MPITSIKGSTPTKPINQDIEGCILECQDCHRVCLDTMQHCLELGGAHAEPEHIQTLLDCAEICATSANLMLRRSALHRLICSACATACARCVETCERSSSDAKMQACAELCRRCAAACQRVAPPSTASVMRAA
jgi:hypothetical protein